MISGMVRHVLHQVRKADVSCANRKHPPQKLLCDSINKFNLFSLDLSPFHLHCGDVAVCIRLEGRADSRPQIRNECRSERRLLPNRQPTPLAADDVHQRISHGPKAAAKITSELFAAQRGSRPQNAAVRPTVIFKKKLDVVLVHGDARPFRSGNLTSAMRIHQALSCQRQPPALRMSSIQENTSQPYTPAPGRARCAAKGAPRCVFFASGIRHRVTSAEPIPSATSWDLLLNARA